MLINAHLGLPNIQENIFQFSIKAETYFGVIKVSIKPDPVGIGAINSFPATKN